MRRSVAGLNAGTCTQYTCGIPIYLDMSMNPNITREQVQDFLDGFNTPEMLRANAVGVAWSKVPAWVEFERLLRARLEADFAPYRSPQSSDASDTAISGPDSQQGAQPAGQALAAPEWKPEE